LIYDNYATITYKENMILSRQWVMPNSETFQMKPAKDIILKYINIKQNELKRDLIIIDPFARDSQIGTITNDLNPNTKAQYHLDASDFLDKLISEDIKGDIVIFDPPYSPRQVKEVYESIGRKVTTQDTQNGRYNKIIKDKIINIINKNGLVISYGWNSCGMGINRGFEITEILLLCHGGSHNDTIITVETNIRN
jgi:hypothetical protein